MLLPLLAMLQQIVIRQTGLGPEVPRAADTIPAFWLPQDNPHAGIGTSGFRQLGIFSTRDRIVANPCGPMAEGGIDPLRRRERALEDSVVLTSTDVPLWIRLGCAQSYLDWPLGGPIAHGEYILAPATAWNIKAIGSLQHAAGLRPNDPAALVLLARATLRMAPGRILTRPQRPLPTDAYGLSDGPLPNNNKASLAAVAATIYQGVRLGGAPVEVVRACTSLMIDIGDFAAAHDCSSRALAAGSDSTWHALRLAWLAFVRSDSIAGAAWFDRAAAAAHDIPSRIELGWHFERQHFVSHSYQAPRGAPVAALPVLDSVQVRQLAEKAQWLALPDSALLPWIRDRVAREKDASAWVYPSGAALVRHFGSIRYDGTAFRDCDAAFDVVPNCSASVTVRVNDVLHIAARRYQLWEPRSGSPATLFVYSVAPEDLAVTEMNGKRSYEIEAHLTESSPGSTALQDTAVTLLVPAPADRKALVAGGVVARTARSFSSWTFMLRQPRSIMRGSVYEEAQRPISAGAVALSDLVIGNANKEGVRWQLADDEHVAAAPSAAADRKVPLQLYYQLRSTAPRNDLKTTIAFAREGEKSPAIQVGSQAPASRLVNEVEQSIDISRLKSGWYRIEVRVADGRGVIDMRSVMVEVR